MGIGPKETLEGAFALQTGGVVFDRLVKNVFRSVHFCSMTEGGQGNAN